MAGESNPEFHHHQPQGPGIVFKSTGGISNISSGELIPMGNYYNNPDAARNSSISTDEAISGTHFFTTSGLQNNSVGPSSELLLDTVTGLKHQAGLSDDWSIEERRKLEEGLAKYANEPIIMRYIKIAASFQDKTVRDIALRCKWIMRKQMKQDDHSLGKKMKDQRDKFEPHMKNDPSEALSNTMPAFSMTPNYYEHGCRLSGDRSFPVKHHLEENNQAFSQISANFLSLKLQENIDIFVRTRNNISTILKEMRSLPGIMSQMPPLPVLLNEELASSIFPHSSQTTMFGSPSLLQLKQERLC